MREIKFRAWHKGNNEWVEVTKHFDIDGDGSMYLVSMLKPIVLMQWTGLLDKNGKAIFEGDIVKYEQPLQLENGEIGIWHGGNRVCRDIRHLDFPEKPEYLKIIGNIYENKDLLK